MSDYPDTPITRKEQYLAAGLDGGDLPDPITREEQYLYEIATKMQGGGSSVTVEPLTVTQNGTTTAPSGKAYNPVAVNVPNSYGASDEGKVVNNGALVAQTAHAPVTQNGTIDTTLNNSVPVNVPNPNYVETITGSLLNPFGTMTTIEIQSLIDSLMANEVTLVLDFTATFMGNTYYIRTAATQAVNNSGSVISRIAFDVFKAPSSGWLGFYITYRVNQGRLAAQASVYFAEEEDEPLYGSVSLEQFLQDATVSATTLTIIHHPLPDSE